MPLSTSVLHFLHADQPKLLHWLQSMQVKQVFLIHAEDDSRKAFSNMINGSILPKLHEVRNLF